MVESEAILHRAIWRELETVVPVNTALHSPFSYFPISHMGRSDREGYKCPEEYSNFIAGIRHVSLGLFIVHVAAETLFSKTGQKITDEEKRKTGPVGIFVPTSTHPPFILLFWSRLVTESASQSSDCQPASQPCHWLLLLETFERIPALVASSQTKDERGGLPQTGLTNMHSPSPFRQSLSSTTPPTWRPFWKRARNGICSFAFSWNKESGEEKWKCTYVFNRKKPAVPTK